MGLSLLTRRGCLGPGGLALWWSRLGGGGLPGPACPGSQPRKDQTTPTFPARAQPPLLSTFRGGAPSEGGGSPAARVPGLFPRGRQEALPPAENQLALHFLCPGPAARPPGEAGCSGLAAPQSALIVCHRTCPAPGGGPARPEARVPPAGRLGSRSGEAGASRARPPRRPPKSRQAERGGGGGPSRPEGPARGSTSPARPGPVTRRAAGVLGAGGLGGLGRRPGGCESRRSSLPRGGRSDRDDVEAEAVGLELDVVPAVTSGGHRQRQQRQGRNPGGRHYNNKGNLVRRGC